MMPFLLLFSGKKVPEASLALFKANPIRRFQRFVKRERFVRF
jgi:hypothetical protein